MSEAKHPDTKSSSSPKIGVFVCHCGGNIADYVDVEAVARAVANEPGVYLARDQVFSCSDAAQQDMIDVITADQLDGIVIASCSPKLHMHTFRNMAGRGGMNPYQYVHVNLREQCAWAHRDDREAATRKAIALVKAGIAKCRLTRPLEPLSLKTTPAVVIIGAGIAGLRSALALSDLGIRVYLVEKSDRVGGYVGQWHALFPDDVDGARLVDQLLEQIRQRDNITLYTGAELVDKTGVVGGFTLTIRQANGNNDVIQAGAIIVATGTALYQPASGELGYGHPQVTTLDAFKRHVESIATGSLTWDGKPVRTVAYIYCVGNRQKKSASCPNPNTYCGRFCCSATVHTSAWVSRRFPEVRQYHLFRDMRAYGRNELLYEEARNAGAVFIRFEENEPPTVTPSDDTNLLVTVKDQLTGGETLELPVDLVVLVTGPVPARNESLQQLLKLPLSKEGFFKEIHLKLRPVETVIDGVFIAGSCQSPKNLEESAGSGLAAVSKAAALLLKGSVNKEPLVARVDPEACAWCGQCDAACPYGAIECVNENGHEVARVIETLCKGEGACVPVCPKDAVFVEGCTDAQIRAMIDSLAGQPEPVKEEVAG
ncbi:MAG: CoB--CoM heterodisulfide reductase iron-sulfur subunit A family protein [Candidatus Hydrogenedentes bacterium]|nr:CoB--CoM heterodisulfide reductase iron-sulfur subunit A family protein [Candidatus Hydrogenedentota bacterium]